MARRYVDDIVLLDDPTILAGLRFALERLKQVVEPAGAAALAAVLAGRIEIRDGERVGVLLSGGNVEVEPARRARGGGRDAAGRERRDRRGGRGRREPPPRRRPEPPWVGPAGAAPTEPPVAPPLTPPESAAAPPVAGHRRCSRRPRRRARDRRAPRPDIPLVTTQSAAGRELRPPGSLGRRHAPGVVLHRPDRPRDGRSARARVVGPDRGRDGARLRPNSRRASAPTAEALFAGLGLAGRSPGSSSRGSNPGPWPWRSSAGRMVERPVIDPPGPRAVAPDVLVRDPGVVHRRASRSCFVQGVVDRVLAPTFGEAVEASVITSTLVTALIGGPFAYVLAGVVLGDVDPFEALRRSFWVFRARKLAAAIVVVFETITALLVLFGIEAGLDIVLRLFESLGLGPESPVDRPGRHDDRGRGGDVRVRDADLHGDRDHRRAAGRHVPGPDPRDARARSRPTRRPRGPGHPPAGASRGSAG